jgi:hypothetical protein
MNKINRTTLIGIVVFTVLLSIGFINWIKPGKDLEQGSNQSRVTMGSSNESNQADSYSETTFAPMYDEESTTPIIQISQDTLNKSPQAQNNQRGIESLEIPAGFGIEGEEEISSIRPSGLREMPVELETPVTGVIPPDDLYDNQQGIEALDPREVGITANDGPEQNYEETALTVQRTLTAVNAEGDKQLIRMKIPVMYKSRTLRLEGSTKTKATEILARLKEKSNQLEKLKEELDADLIDWNNLVKAATPYDTLLPESPTLPQNQSAGGLNRENNPEMSAGKAISYEIVNTDNNN